MIANRTNVPSVRGWALALALVLIVIAQPSLGQTNWVLLGWNNLGMHCMDSDYSVFSVLPPYNTVNAQLVKRVGTGRPQLVAPGGGLSLFYRAVGDPTGSTNSTSLGKSNFEQYSGVLYGATPAPDAGLPIPGPSYAMPGTNNVPQAMGYESGWNWFVAYGIPITPYDDAGRPNSYPLMRLAAGTTGGTDLAHSDVVLPVSDEMDCRLCHHSGRGAEAEPSAGWARDRDPGRDYRRNILLLHDEMQATNPLYASALASNGLNRAGLHASVVEDGRPVLCASCHLSEALPGSGILDIPPLTQAIHRRHGGVLDPRNGMTLGVADNRDACYTCHPGSSTRCLRGAMGRAVAADGSLAMQCQSCHGSMADVASPARTGWLDEPNCQSCHSGDAVSNEGQIRFLASHTGGVQRAVSNRRFATNPDTPAAGHSLYRFSSGHGGLHCSACHGSTHAIYPSAQPNDNLQNMALQGEAGTLGDCAVCHGEPTEDGQAASAGGPHGMHSVGPRWVKVHHDRVSDPAACAVCHGTDYRGTVLSRALRSRTLSGSLEGASYELRLWKGFQVGCYACHQGPDSSDPTGNLTPVANSISALTASAVPVTFALPGSDSDGPTATYRIVSQPDHGTVALSGAQATYRSGAGFSGTDRFTFARWDGYTDSNLATGTVTVVEADSVGDGVADWWRQLHFGGDGTTTNATSSALADPDHDGQDNISEYRSGTDPNDDWSVVRLFAVTADGEETALHFASWLGQRFSIERADSLLVPGSWTVILDEVWGRSDSAKVVVPTPPGPGPWFYRTRQSEP